MANTQHLPSKGKKVKTKELLEQQQKVLWNPSGTLHQKKQAENRQAGCHLSVLFTQH